MITFNDAKKILDTLPIGYYLKTGNCIDVELSVGAPTSYADLIEKKIVIAFHNLVKAMPKHGDAEENIRCLLYHELSHIIATPDCMLHNIVHDPSIRAKTIINDDLAKDLINIFEDERIETMFSKTYYGVNFKRFVFNVNGLDYDNPVYPQPKAPIDIFYQAVRYHYGDPNFLDEIAGLLFRYRTHYSNLWTNSSISDYGEKIFQMYVKYCVKNQKFNTNTNKTNVQSPESQNADQGSNKQKTDKQTPNPQNPNTQNPDTQATEQRNLNSLLPDEFVEQASAILIADFVKGSFSKFTSGLSGVKEIVEKALRKYSNKSSAVNAYSGRINPRSIISNQQDYRWFTKKNNGGSQKLFDKICLNIICDESGSFCSSEDTMNGMFMALKQLEKDHPEFEFNLVTISQGAKRKEKTERKIDCNGGSSLEYKQTKEVLDSLPRSNATIKNLVLMDGKFHLDGEVFSLFNSPNYKIVSDMANERQLKEQAPLAKKHFCKNYAKEFKTVLLQTLEETFAY